MIQINLLPSERPVGRSRRNITATLVRPAMRAVGSQVRDPYLLGAIGSVAAAAAAVFWLYSGQTHDAEMLRGREEAAVRDSTRFATVIGDRQRALAKRDSVIRELDFIQALDNDRFVWPHIMDEVSRALPPYTWLKSIQESVPAAAPPPEPVKPAKPGKEAPLAIGHRPAAPAHPPVRFQIVGNTVDVQALTRFMTALEESPFVQRVQLAKSELITVDGKAVTEFQLTAEYQRPDAGSVTTVPLSLMGK